MNSLISLKHAKPNSPTSQVVIVEIRNYDTEEGLYEVVFAPTQQQVGNNELITVGHNIMNTEQLREFAEEIKRCLNLLDDSDIKEWNKHARLKLSFLSNPAGYVVWFKPYYDAQQYMKFISGFQQFQLREKDIKLSKARIFNRVGFVLAVNPLTACSRSDVAKFADEIYQLTDSE
jgi:hypothetical protein